jgi:hypothetical protein
MAIGVCIPLSFSKHKIEKSDPITITEMPHLPLPKPSQLPYLLHGIDKFGGGFPLFGHLNPIDVHISHRFRITECYAFGITVTKVAFHGNPFVNIKEWVSKGACNNTGPATDT